MEVDQVVELGRTAILTALILGAPVMIVAVVTGLVISILQAVTQVQDQTLSFVPKIIAMMVVLLMMLPWTIQIMVEYSTELFESIPSRF